MLDQSSSFFFFGMDALKELSAQARGSWRLDATDTLIVLGAAVILIGLLFFWAAFLRKRPDEKFGAPSLTRNPKGRSKRKRPSSSARRSGFSERSHGDDDGSSNGSSSSSRRMVRRRAPRNPVEASVGGESEGSQKRVRVRRRRRRENPDNFPRNPTLGETGGLPPLRPEEPDPASESESASGEKASE